MGYWDQQEAHENLLQENSEMKAELKGRCMEPNEKLAELEARVIEHGLKKLESMTKGVANDYFGKCEIRHLEEMVKLAHRLRSLLAPEASEE